MGVLLLGDRALELGSHTGSRRAAPSWIWSLDAQERQIRRGFLNPERRRDS